MVEVMNNDVTSESELKQRFDKISKELTEVWGPETMDDKIEINDVILDWRFAEFLLKNEIYLTRLKTYVETISNNGLSKKAWNSFNDLKKFLNDIWDNGEMSKDYNKFMDKLKNPKDLHKMKDDEVRKLGLYLATNENAALEAYRVMKSFEDVDRWYWSATLLGTGMKMEDINVFQWIKRVLKESYQNNERFIEMDYPGYQNLSVSSQSIKSFLETHKWVLSGPWLEWDWTELTVAHIGDKKNSIVSKEAIVAKLNEFNNQRIENNKKFVEAVIINYTASDFTKSNWVLKYKWNEFTKETLRTYFQDEMRAAVTGWDFVNDIEKNRLVEQCNDAIFNNIKNKLLSDPNVKDDKIPEIVSKTENEMENTTEKNQDKLENEDKNSKENKKSVNKKKKGKKNGKSNNGENTEAVDKSENNKDKNSEKVEQRDVGMEYVSKENVVRIKDSKLKNKIRELWFCENLDWGSVKFNVAKIKEYLTNIQAKSWKQLQKQKPLDKKVWIIAVQVSLNHLSTYDNKSAYAVKFINWIYKADTMNWVKAFQKDNWLKVDGRPWSNTIKKLVEKLWWSSVGKSDVNRKTEDPENNLNSNKNEVSNQEWNKTELEGKNPEEKVEQKTNVEIGTSIQNNSNVSINIDGNNTGNVVGSKSSNEVVNNVGVSVNKNWKK